MLMSVLVMSGCATQQPVEKPYADVEPALVGIPIQERLAKSSKNISEQLDLLARVNSGQKISNYEVVEHNNKVDARIGSNKTIPYAYAFQEEIKIKEQQNLQKQQELALEREKMMKTLNTKVKAIDWKNNSANQLAKQFADAMGYELVVDGSKDQNIVFNVKDVTLIQAINEYQKLMAPIAEVVIVDQNKTFNIFYK